MSEYREESDALDADLLRIIHAWHKHGTALDDAAFNHLALRIFAYQLRYNGPYAQYCASLGITTHSLPARWEAIPAVPTTAFKDVPLTTFDPSLAFLAFETSGTTLGRGGTHYMEKPLLYDAALLAGFDRFMLADSAALRYFNVVPNPVERAQSSLGYMMANVSAYRGDAHTGWYVQGEALLTHAFRTDLQAAIEASQPVCIAGTAFGLLGLMDAFDQRPERFALPPGSRIMETGGFKGRTRTVSRTELYEKLTDRFGVDATSIVAEYGMTELTSQYYDSKASRNESRRIKAAPPWLRTRIVDVAGESVGNGIVGALVHYDLANRSSVLAVSTEDLGASAGEGFVLLGRDANANLRGWSLDAEDLQHTHG
ncbi:MAG: hypothetical protein M3N19_00175 [Candidatus Eremiobacteraeota bacterium]|nr:hypothetical protein [Candidatus Eremiobacteraeota bacterium]